MAATTTPGGAATTNVDRDVPWHALKPEEACARLGVDGLAGLDPAEVERRRAQHGPNKLADAEKEPGWRAFLRQYRDLMSSGSTSPSTSCWRSASASTAVPGLMRRAPRDASAPIVSRGSRSGSALPPS